MRVLSTEALRELDRRTIAGGVPGAVLMGRAAKGIAKELARAQRIAPEKAASCLIIAGTGNNGGDGFGIARLLQEAGWHVRVWVAGCQESLSGDARLYVDRALAAGVEIVWMPDPASWPQEAFDLPLVSWCVDALLGTGSRGAPRGVIAAAVGSIRALREDAVIVAVDIPTGLDADRGEAYDPNTVVYASQTFTLGAPKPGLLIGSAAAFTGSVETVALGFDFSLLELEKASPGDVEVLVASEIRNLLPRRSSDAHKGAVGHSLLVGGSPGMTGAIAMAALAALRSGCGLVTILTPEVCAQEVDFLCPEALVIPGASAENGCLQVNAWRELQEMGEERFSSILIGPGMRNTPSTAELTRVLLAETTLPVVIDADGLNVLASDPQWISRCRNDVVLTPHPGEMSRLCGCPVSEIQKDRVGSLNRFVARDDATVILKGAGSLIRTPAGKIWMNLNGNPGMATAGTGDVLAGLLAGLLAQGMASQDAACAATYLHGRAGDFANRRKGTASMLARDLLDAFASSFEA